MEYAAHIRADGKIQTVSDHLSGTASFAYEFGTAAELADIGKLEGSLHDIGKLCQDFNDYINGESRYKRGDIDHSYAGAKYLLKHSENSVAALLTARVIVSHHGLHDWLNEDGKDYLELRTKKDERYSEIEIEADKLFKINGITELLKSAEAEFNEAVKKIKKAIADSAVSDALLQKRQFGFYLGMLERLMESILVDADRTDTESFMTDHEAVLYYDRKNLWASMHTAMEAKCAEFKLLSDKISVQRASISERCAEFAKRDVGACRLVVPTGGGKTLSSLRFAIEYCKRRDMDRIIYVAPFMSILEQNGDVIKDLIGKEYEELYLEHHSEIQAQLADNKDELNEYEIRAVKWDSPVIATTFVQFLNTLFSGNMSSVRRMHRLCRSVVIIDEIQSLPLKCVYMFNMAINFLTRICSSTVVLCSATQPLLENVKYPLLLDSRDKMTGDHTKDFIAFKRTQLIDNTRAGGYSYEEAAEICYEKYRGAGNILIIVNTKNAAKEMYQLLKEKDSDSDIPAELFHLSTGMCSEHRRSIVSKMKSSLGKQPVICVTTQLIEAGVDISFKCVVRSLAGLDNAAQAAGRCNRNGESDCCDVYLINIRDEKLKYLSDIDEAGKITQAVINSKKFDDLLSVEAMSGYFSKLYNEREAMLSFPVKDCMTDTDLVDLLSVSSSRGKLSNNGIYQCFEKAGKDFGVIDNNTTAVIVPYNDEAESLISELLSSDAYADHSQLLRKAQKYSVNLFEHTLKKLLESGAVYKSEKGFYFLNDGYYSEEYGISDERINIDFLAF